MGLLPCCCRAETPETRRAYLLVVDALSLERQEVSSSFGRDQADAHGDEHPAEELVKCGLRVESLLVGTSERRKLHQEQG